MASNILRRKFGFGRKNIRNKKKAGNNNTGDMNTDAGNSNTGDTTAGDNNTGDTNAGDTNAGDTNAGDTNAGNSNTEDTNVGDMNAEVTNAGTGAGANIPNFTAIIPTQEFLDNYYQDPPSSPLVAREISLLAKQNHELRKEDLDFLKKVLNSEEAPLSDAAQIQKILPRVLEATLAVSEDVRKAAVSVLKSIPPPLAQDHIEEVLPFVRAGITHLAANVAGTSLDILEWLIRSYGDRLVSCKGGWVKTLKCFLVMLRWTAETRPGGWTFSRTSYKDGKNFQGVSFIKCLSVLGPFLRAGLMRPRKDRVPMSQLSDFPLWGRLGALLPTDAAGGFSCLDLFGSPLDYENCECPDVDTRKEALKPFRPALEQGLSGLSRDGGLVAELAKEAAEILRRGLGNALGYQGDAFNETVGDPADCSDNEIVMEPAESMLTHFSREKTPWDFDVSDDDEDFETEEIEQGEAVEDLDANDETITSTGIEQGEAVETAPNLLSDFSKDEAVEESPSNDADGPGKTA